MNTANKMGLLETFFGRERNVMNQTAMRQTINITKLLMPMWKCMDDLSLFVLNLEYLGVEQYIQFMLNIEHQSNFLLLYGYNGKIVKNSGEWIRPKCININKINNTSINGGAF